MKVGELKARLSAVADDAEVCVAELDEAFATTVAELEVLEAAEVETDDDVAENVALAGGSRTVVVLRW